MEMMSIELKVLPLTIFFFFVPPFDFFQQSEQIFLTDNTIYGTIPSEMSSLSQLERLLLPRNQLSGRIPSQIGLFEKLEVLSLGRNILSNGIPSEIGMLTNLRSLNAHHNDLQGRIPTEVGNLSKLEFLSFESNLLTGTLPDELSGLTSLTTLALEDNALKGIVPSGVCNNVDVQDKFKVSVDCDMVQCSCCTPACAEISDDSQQSPPTPALPEIPTPAPPTPSPTLASPPTASIPSIDSSSVEQVQGNNSYSITVGSECYVPDNVIDFKTEMSKPEAFDIVTLVSLPSSTVGNGPSLSLGDSIPPVANTTVVTGESPVLQPTYTFTDNSLYWAATCNTVECNGVFADGFVYYLNGLPGTSRERPTTWPLAAGWYQLQLVQVDETSLAYVTARSLPFEVTDTC